MDSRLLSIPIALILLAPLAFGYEDSAKVWTDKGIELGKLGQHAEAEKFFDKAIEKDPRFAEAWYFKGLSLHYLGKFDESIAAFDESIEINPQDPDAWYNKGLALHRLRHIR